MVFYEEQETNKNFANIQIEKHPEYPTEEEDALAEEDHYSLEKTLLMGNQEKILEDQPDPKNYPPDLMTMKFSVLV